jgi:hypothetical protein
MPDSYRDGIGAWRCLICLQLQPCDCPYHREQKAPLATGELVWYLQTQRGGYGYQQRVPGVYVRPGSARVQIEVLKRDGSRARIWVARKNLIPRGPDEGIRW